MSWVTCTRLDRTGSYPHILMNIRLAQPSLLHSPCKCAQQGVSGADFEDALQQMQCKRQIAFMLFALYVVQEPPAENTGRSSSASSAGFAIPVGADMKVFNFGSVNIDHVYRVPHLVAPGETLSSHSLETVLGGKGANQSVALARAGVDVFHIGQLGKTDSWARDIMSDAGVNVSHVSLLDGASGHAIIQVDDAGENSIILHGGANQQFTREQLASVLEQADEGDWLLMQNECNMLADAFDIALRLGLHIAFNPAPMTPAVMQLPLASCALLIVNETEAALMSGDDDPITALTALSRHYSDTRLVLTLGSKGAMLQHGSSQLSQEVMKVKAVDSTGAGDTFVGYYLASLIDGLNDESALQRACAAAALSVTREGATPSIPLAAQVDEILLTAH